MVKGVRKMRTFALRIHSVEFCIIEIHRQKNRKLHSCFLSSIFYLNIEEIFMKKGGRNMNCLIVRLLDSCIKAVLLKFNHEVQAYTSLISWPWSSGGKFIFRLLWWLTHHWFDIVSNGESYSCRAFSSRNIYKRCHDNDDSDVMSNCLTLKNQLKHQYSIRKQHSRWLSTYISQQWLHLPRKHSLFRVERTLH